MSLILRLQTCNGWNEVVGSEEEVGKGKGDNEEEEREEEWEEE